MGNSDGAVKTAPDGYAICPRCDHHTSAYCGSCTVISPETFRYCGCDCYEALYGISWLDKIAEALHGKRNDANTGIPGAPPAVAGSEK